MFSAEEKKQISQWNNRQTDIREIRLCLTSHPRSEEMKSFYLTLSECASNIRTVSQSLSSQEPPYVELPFGIRYQALASGTKMTPFLEILEAALPALPGPTRKWLDRIEKPGQLTLYIAGQCPYCPSVLRQIWPLATGSRVRLTVIDVRMFEESAAADRVQSVPTLITDDDFRWTGTVKIEEIARYMALRNPACLTADTLEQMIAGGMACELAGMMKDRQEIFPDFIRLLCHEKWPVRLGAMVAAETLAEQDRELASALEGPLWDSFDRADERAKGDMLYVIGQCGTRDSLFRLQPLVEGGYSPEIREAGREAMESLLALYPEGKDPVFS
jgi:hypothetical protein